MAAPLWKQWSIDLASVGASLKAVKTLAIGVSGPGKGTLYIDDILLYRVALAVIVPTDPGADGLAAFYRMEGDVNDSSGKGYHGTAVGDPACVSSVAGFGQAVQFEGVDDRLDGDVVAGGVTNTLPRDLGKTTQNWLGRPQYSADA